MHGLALAVRLPRSGASALILVALCMLALAASAPVAEAAVSVTRAELSGQQLRVEGRGAQPSSLVRVTSDISSASGSADSSGNFRIESGSFRASDCRVTVADPVSSTTATLSGCTPTNTSTFQIDDRPPGDGNVGTDYNRFVTATGGTGSLRWSIAAGALPDGLAIRDFAPGSGHIFGRPTTVQTSAFTVRATDEAGRTATRQFTIVINPPRPLVLTNEGVLSPGTVGEPYEIGVFADGGTTPYSWTLVGGDLPPGLALQTSPGRIQGTPTTPGTFNFSLRADDSAGQSATGAYSIIVSQPAPPPSPPPAPTLASPENGASVATPFTISWNSVADAQGIRAYNWHLSTSSTFSSSAAAGTVAGDVTQASVTSILPPGTYFWRVNAVDGENAAGAYSAVRSVTVTGTTNPPALIEHTATPQPVGGGATATGTVRLDSPAPADGTVITLASGDPAVAGVPGSVTVPQGASSANYPITTAPTVNDHTVVITAALNGDNRFLFLQITPGGTTSSPAASDTVAIQRAEYNRDRRTLIVEATSTSTIATMRVFNTASGAQIGTLNNRGGGLYSATFSNIRSNPGSVTVRSSLGGSASRTVTVR